MVKRPEREPDAKWVDWELWFKPEWIFINKYGHFESAVPIDHHSVAIRADDGAIDECVPEVITLYQKWLVDWILLAELDDVLLDQKRQ